ncbi:MAG: hypothetical protein HFI33_02200 [Lachnospiraceae bacterium]|nr:hypothetical protein [Lachnospiraceae bacterium]
MFGFGKKKQGLEGLKEQAALYEKKMELTKLAETYYQMGKAYQEQEDLERARLYLERASTLYSNFDEIYDACQGFMEDCDEYIGDLEEEALLGNEILEQVEEKAEELSNAQKYLWGLLSLSRFQVVFQKLADCENCRILGELSRVLDMLYRTVGQNSTEEDWDYSLDFITRYYDFCNSEAFVDTSNQVELDNGTTLQLFDFNGNSTAICLHLFVDTFISVLQGGFDTVEENEDAEVDFIPCTLMADYYLRNYEGDIRQLPQVQAEISRIWSDYELVKSGSIADVIHQVEKYRRMSIL